jgi:hypothetical protein
MATETNGLFTLFLPGTIRVTLGPIGSGVVGGADAFTMVMGVVVVVDVVFVVFACVA